ncbi:hypothetical protein ASO20_00390 [Mycoplasma sp. (ex Biomphalaria glabrata)]|uniref:hypothetical protein n=1 Tax=Mycoplasma sp. (ex Biomphalaria glabrata) TaxID=1749074 RepID=UPI00073A6C19|nr:hypothetical protein [Mycoplasma sp. (ex Biomphalaria glabrata)]ALV23140.1 hypothetical protein ASO20_00390 [Mycoplasma sp. (ex Biomphalaria glabrata)]
MNYFSIYGKLEKVNDFYILKTTAFSIKVELIGNNFELNKNEYFISTFFNHINYQTKYYAFDKLEIKLLFDELMLIKRIGPKTAIQLVNNFLLNNLTNTDLKIQKIITKYQVFL